jgi:hypothetical protein
MRRVAMMFTLVAALFATRPSDLPAYVVAVRPPPAIGVPAVSREASFTVSWRLSATSRAVYELQEAEDAKFLTGRVIYRGVGISTTLYRRTNGKTYYYRVRATRPYYAPSAWVAGANGCLVNRVVGAPASVTVPPASTTGAYTVSWGLANIAGASYELEEATDPAFTAGRVAYTGTLRTAAITGRESGKTYYYRVRALVVTWYPSPWTSGANGCAVSLADSQPPPQVSDFTAQPGTSQVDLAWVNPADADFAGVRVLRRTDRYPAAAADGDLVYDGTAQSSTQFPLDTGTYYYGAFSYDARGNYSTPAIASAAVTVKSCTACHANPPLRDAAAAGGSFDRLARPDAESYPGGAGAHQRHQAALGDALLTCEICHGPGPGTAAWHNQGAATLAPGNVDIIGQMSFWDPTATRAGGYDGAAGVANPDAGLWEFTAKAKAGGDQRCYNLACHGDAPDEAGALNWTDRMVDETGAFVGDGERICIWCHDATPASLPAAGAGSVAAPNVIDGPIPSSDSLSYNWYGTNETKQDGGHGDPQGRDASRAKPTCADCHDLAQPAPGNSHANGAYESIWDNTTRTANTAHLKVEFFTPGSFPNLLPKGYGPWDMQVAFDTFCTVRCHTTPPGPVPFHSHEVDTPSTRPDYYAVQMGTHGTLTNGDALQLGKSYPMIRDLTTDAPETPFYAACVSCHDPHGTTLVPQGSAIVNKPSNRMLRDNWGSPATLCLVCHA